jgi:hypothetical protein
MTEDIDGPQAGTLDAVAGREGHANTGDGLDGMWATWTNVRGADKHVYCVPPHRPLQAAGHTPHNYTHPQ